MRTLGYMPTEMELIEVSQHVKMRSQCLTPPPRGGAGRGGWAEPPGFATGVLSQSQGYRTEGCWAVALAVRQGSGGGVRGVAWQFQDSLTTLAPGHGG